MNAIKLAHNFGATDAGRQKSPSDVPQRLWDEALNKPVNLFLSGCGKRIRAAMVIESFRIAGGVGEPPEMVSEAIELLHAGSLIIDDIEDDSQLRRGQPTLHRKVGLPLALNTGNWMYFQAIEKLSKLPLHKRSLHRMVSHTIQTIRRCHEGQALDLHARVDRLARSDIRPTVRAISRLKTGGLTALSVRLGADAANASPLIRKALGRFGMNVGVCLQMHNDLLELREFAQGGERCDDLRNRRVTWPWGWAAKWISRPKFAALQNELSSFADDHGRLRELAADLHQLVGSRGQTLIARRLERELRLLGEHVESTDTMRVALDKLQR